MASKTLDPWLGEFITRQVADLVNWRRSLAIEPSIKQEITEGVDYSHDFSNIRSHHTAAPSQESRVQLLEVLSAGDHVTAYVSDGKTRIRARLDRAAVMTLEESIGVELNKGVEGDVFIIERFTVVCTHMGPSDGFVQLEIERVNYEFHLRKIVGQPKPIENDAAITTLVKEIAAIWNQENPVSIDSDEYDEEDRDDNSALRALKQENPPLQPGPSKDTTPKPIGRANSRRIRRHSVQFEKDGLEIQRGINLDLPLQPSMRPVISRPLVSTKPIERAQLIRLIGRDTKARAVPDPADQHTTRMKVLPNDAPTSPIRSSAPVLPVSSPTRSGSAPPSQAQPAPSSMASQPRVPSGRRKIPKDQQKLLDHPSSWFPPLPGQQFPIPNVPIDLLKTWSKAVDDQQSLNKASPPKSTASPNRSVSSDADMSISDSSDEEFSASQWPESPPRREPDLPPDSSVGSVVQGSPDTDGLEVSFPRALQVRKSPIRHVKTPKDRLTYTTPPAAAATNIDTQPPSIGPRNSLPEPSSLLRQSTYSSSSRSSLQSEQSLLSQSRHPPSHQAPPILEQQTGQYLPDANLKKSLYRPPKHTDRENRRSHTGFTERPSFQEFSTSNYRGHRRPTSPSPHRIPTPASDPLPAPGATRDIHDPKESEPDMQKEWHSRKQRLARSDLYSTAPQMESAGRAKEENVLPAAASGAEMVSTDPPRFSPRDPRIRWKSLSNAYHWLSESYVPDLGGKTHFSAVFTRYRLAFPNDKEATEDNLMYLIARIFPDAENISRKMKFRRLPDAMPVRPQTQARVLEEDLETTARLPTPPGPPFSPAFRRLPPDPDMHKVIDSKISIDDPTPPSRQPVISSSVSLEDSRLAKPTRRGPSSSNSVSRSTQSRPPDLDDQTTDIVPIYKQHLDFWSAVAPGGAFADPQPVYRVTGRNRKRRVDVLAWEIEPREKREHNRQGKRAVVGRNREVATSHLI